MPSRVMLGCPIHVSKEYSMGRWCDAVDRIAAVTRGRAEVTVLTVDNSPNRDFMLRWQHRIPILHLEETEAEAHPYVRINKSMEELKRVFTSSVFDYWFNLECDVIPGPESLPTMLRYAGRDMDWVAHAYPMRGAAERHEVLNGIGCSLLSRNLVESFDFREANQDSFDVWLWDVMRKARRFKAIELWGVFPVEHLAE